MTIMRTDLFKLAKQLPPPHFGVVSIPLRLLPAYYELWNIEPIAGSWKYSVGVHDHFLGVRKLDAPKDTGIQSVEQGSFTA